MKKYTEYIVNRIKDICKNYPRRQAGYPSTRAAGDDIAKELSSYADTVEKQDFTISPKAFMLSITLFPIFFLIAVGLSWVAYYCNLIGLYLAADAVIVLGYAIVIAEYVLYFRFIDPICRKKKGQNVFAVRKAKGESKRRIIICGHVDAAFEMPLMMKCKIWLLGIIIGSALIGSIAAFMLNNIMFLNFMPKDVYMIFIIIESVFAVLASPLLFFIDYNTVVDGANDNLTGCFIATSILKEMAENDKRFENTDVCCLITDGEESGLRGSTAFARKNIEMLMEKNTVVIAVDTIYDKKELQIYSRGINFTEANAEEVCDLLYFSGLKHGLELPYAGFYPGAVDSEAFSREGVKSAGICGVCHTPAPYYHTRYDTADNIRPECIELVRDIINSTVEMFDGAGKSF